MCRESYFVFSRTHDGAVSSSSSSRKGQTGVEEEGVGVAFTQADDGAAAEKIKRKEISVPLLQA